MIKRENYFKHIAIEVKRARLKTRSRIVGKEENVMSQEELTLLLGYKNGQFISNIERAKAGLPLTKVCKFCQITKIDTDSLIKAILHDHNMTINGVVYKDPARKMIKIRMEL